MNLLEKFLRTIALTFMTLLTLICTTSARPILEFPENPEEVYGAKDKVVCVTCPKCGTHLLVKCLGLLQIEGINYNFDEDKVSKERTLRPYSEIFTEEYGDRAFSRLTYRIQELKDIKKSYLLHLPFHEKHRKFFNDYTIANFLMVRNPCAQITSLAATALPDPYVRDENLSKILLDILQGTENYTPFQSRHGACDLMWTTNIVEFFNSFLQWEKEPNFLVVHYEDLVGPQGGGTLERQREIIFKIAAHLGVIPSKERIQYVMDNLYGQTKTFKQGQIDGWKKYFTPEVIEAFNAIPGSNDLLERMGYERLDNL